MPYNAAIFPFRVLRSSKRVPQHPAEASLVFGTKVANACRVKHLSHRTEQSYVAWVRRFILFHNKRHPRELAPTGCPQPIGRIAEIRSSGKKKPQGRVGRDPGVISVAGATLRSNGLRNAGNHPRFITPEVSR